MRRATPEDAAACQAIYAPYVRDTVISLETDPPGVEVMRGRIEEVLATHDWLVLDVDGEIRGYAYGGTYRTRAAYRWACEVSVYLEQGRRRTGAGRMLYEALFPRLVDRGYLTALAGMTLPNPASEGLHRSLGFDDVGTWRRHRLEVRRLARRAVDAAAPRDRQRTARGALLSGPATSS